MINLEHLEKLLAEANSAAEEDYMAEDALLRELCYHAPALLAELKALRDENARFRNGFDNLLAAFKEAPGLPLECLPEDELSKWTDTITGILMALGPYMETGRPLTIMEALREKIKDDHD